MKFYKIKVIVHTAKTVNTKESIKAGYYFKNDIQQTIDDAIQNTAVESIEKITVDITSKDIDWEE